MKARTKANWGVALTILLAAAAIEISASGLPVRRNQQRNSGNRKFPRRVSSPMRRRSAGSPSTRRGGWPGRPSRSGLGRWRRTRSARSFKPPTTPRKSPGPASGSAWVWQVSHGSSRSIRSRPNMSQTARRPRRLTLTRTRGITRSSSPGGPSITGLPRSRGPTSRAFISGLDTTRNARFTHRPAATS